MSLLTAAVKAEGRDGQPHAFTVVSPAQKNYMLQADTEADMHGWMAAIQVPPCLALSWLIHCS